MKSNKEPATVTSLKNTLAEINSLGLCTKDALAHNARLYNQLFSDIDNLIAKTVFYSNFNRGFALPVLMNHHEDLDDIRMECIERIVTKLDYVLAFNLKGQHAYIIELCNNVILDLLRKYKNVVPPISMDEAVNNHASDSDNFSKTLKDYIIDTNASPETKYLVKEAILEIFQKYSNNSDNLLCILAKKVFEDKPRDLAYLLIQKGSVEKVLLYYIEELSARFDINISDFPPISQAKTTGLTKLLRRKDFDSHTLANKISNIVNRVK